MISFEGESLKKHSHSLLFFPPVFMVKVLLEILHWNQMECNPVRFPKFLNLGLLNCRLKAFSG